MNPVTFTERAIQEIKHIIEAKNIPAMYGLRVGVKGGGCAGVEYIIGFDKQHTSDAAFDIQGIPLFVEKKCFMHLIGVQVDFYEGNDARGFVFRSASQTSTWYPDLAFDNFAIYSDTFSYFIKKLWYLSNTDRYQSKNKLHKNCYRLF